MTRIREKIPATASELYATNLINLLKLLIPTSEQLVFNPEDEIIKQAGFNHSEAMKLETITDFLNPPNIRQRIFGGRVILAKDAQGNIMGFAFYATESTHPYSGWLSYMVASDGYKEKDFKIESRGKGLGSALLTKVIRDQLAMGRVALDLRDAESTRALSFYYKYTGSEYRTGYSFRPSTIHGPGDIKFPEYTKNPMILSVYDFQRAVPYIPADANAAKAPDSAMSVPEDSSSVFTKGKADLNKNGGIDLTHANMNLQTQNNGGEIKFHIDPAMLQQLQNAPGFTPVIINIQPMKDLKVFLGIGE